MCCSFYFMSCESLFLTSSMLIINMIALYVEVQTDMNIHGYILMWMVCERGYEDLYLD